jgi:hypothetical protein
VYNDATLSASWAFQRSEVALSEVGFPVPAAGRANAADDHDHGTGYDSPFHSHPNGWHCTCSPSIANNPFFCAEYNRRMMAKLIGISLVIAPILLIFMLFPRCIAQVVRYQTSVAPLPDEDIAFSCDYELIIPTPNERLLRSGSYSIVAAMCTIFLRMKRS